MRRAGGVRCSSHPLSSDVSLLLPPVSTHLFSLTGDVLYHQNFLTHRLIQYQLRGLRALVKLAVSSFVFAAAVIALCCILTSLEFAELRILHAAPAVIRPGTTHFALSCYELFASLALGRLLFSLQSLVQTLGSFLGPGTPRSLVIPQSV